MHNRGEKNFGYFEVAYDICTKRPMTLLYVSQQANSGNYND